MPKHPDLVGQKFARLTVVALRPDRDKNGNVMWDCICDCGKTSIVRTNGLRSGRSLSCGCYWKERTIAVNTGNTYTRKSAGDNAKRYLFERYKKDAEKRGFKFEITFDDFIKLVQGNCYYCGAPKSRICHPKNAYGGFIYTGIDRVINHLGYVYGNCVSCCTKCNSIKNGVTIEMILQIYYLLFEDGGEIMPSPLFFDGSIHL